MNPKQSAVFLATLGPGRGNWIARTRPTGIIQNDIDNRFSGVTIIVPIMSRYDPTLPMPFQRHFGHQGRILRNP